MHVTRKIVLAAALGLTVAGAGGAIAATKLSSPQEESQAVLDDAAKQLGVQPSELSAALKKALSNRVDQAVTDGRLTKAEGDALKARINSGDFPLLGVPLGRGFHHFGRGPDEFPGHKHFLSTAADYLGLTEGQLRTQLNSGKTLARIAKDQGKSVDGLVDKLVAEKKARIEAAVKDGRLTRAEADRIEADLKQAVTDFVNNGRLELHFRRFGPGPWQHGFFGHGHVLESASEYLGLSEAQLRTQLDSGKTLAQIAKDQGKSVEGLVDRIVADEKVRIEAAVKDGRLTRAEADRIEADLKQAVTDFVNNTEREFQFRKFREWRGADEPPMPRDEESRFELPLVS